MILSGLYVSNIDISNLTDGVAKKILMQMDAFKNANMKIKYIKVPKEYQSSFGKKVLSRLPFFPVAEKWTGVDVRNFDYIYIRKGSFDAGFLSFLKKAKKNGVKKIVLELPTFPYDIEMRNRWQKYPYYCKDKFYRKRIYRYIDRVITYSTDSSIFEIPTIRIVNGIDFSDVKIRKVKQCRQNDIHLLCVASMSFWHGFDRLLNGLKDYYSTKNVEHKTKVYLHFVGEGTESQKYMTIVNNYDISEYVVFHGQLNGANLDSIYDNCNIGICSLGCHRKGIKLSSELKTREYVAKGIPMVTSCNIDVFPVDKCDFIKSFSADESAIQITEIIKWYDSLIEKYVNEDNLSERIRSFGENVCDINKTMKPVIDYFKSYSTK